MSHPLGRDNKNFFALRRPWLDAEGNAWVMLGGTRQKFNPDQSPVRPTLTKEQWDRIDRSVVRAYSYRTPITAKLIELGLVETVPTGIAQTEHKGMLLPITHSDWWHVHADVGWADKDSVMCEASGRRVGEAVEQVLLGIHKHEHTRRVIGLFNQPDPLKVKCPKLNHKNIHAVAKLMLLRAVSCGFGGPFMFVYGPLQDANLDMDWCPDDDSPTLTNRQAIVQINQLPSRGPSNKVRDHVPVNVIGVTRSDFLQDEFALMQLTSDVVEVFVAQSLIVCQWENLRDDQTSFKTLACIVPHVGRSSIVLAEQEK